MMTLEEFVKSIPFNEIFKSELDGIDVPNIKTVYNTNTAIHIVNGTQNLKERTGILKDYLESVTICSPSNIVYNDNGVWMLKMDIALKCTAKHNEYNNGYFLIKIGTLYYTEFGKFWYIHNKIS